MKNRLLRAASHVKESLGLKNKQQTLWHQVASKSGASLRVRLSRRENLQADLTAKLADPRLELRDLGAGDRSRCSLQAAAPARVRKS